MVDLVRKRVMWLRLIACLMLLIAAALPTSTCLERGKARAADGSLTWGTSEQERTLWQEISDQSIVLDTSMTILCYGWPLPFLMIRGLRKTQRTRWPLGLAEFLVGGFFMLGTWAVSSDPCWSIYDELSDPRLLFGFYLAVAGGGLYLLAWPLEAILVRRRRILS